MSALTALLGSKIGLALVSYIGTKVGGRLAERFGGSLLGKVALWAIRRKLPKKTDAESLIEKLTGEGLTDEQKSRLSADELALINHEV